MPTSTAAPKNAIKKRWNITVPRDTPRAEELYADLASDGNFAIIFDAPPTIEAENIIVTVHVTRSDGQQNYKLAKKQPLVVSAKKIVISVLKERLTDYQYVKAAGGEIAYWPET